MYLKSDRDALRGAHEGMSAGSGPTTLCTFLAFGTRGDVQPLLIVAEALRERLGCVVRFVSHACHRYWIESLAPSIHFIAVPTPALLPFRAPSGDGGGGMEGGTSGAAAEVAQEDSSLWSEEQQSLCLLACGAFPPSALFHASGNPLFAP